MKRPKASRRNLKNKTIVHILTGSIAAYKAGDLIQDLRNEGARIVCVMTESAKHFVTPLVLRALSGQKVYHDFFSADTPYDVLHTSLAEEADLVLVAPASADFIARAANGLASDLATCVLLATKKPVLLAPAMNDQMYHHPLTQENIQKLRKIGYHFADPIEGPLVCGKEAIGHIIENQDMLDLISRILSQRSH